MAVRYTDAKKIKSASRDFIVRKYKPSLPQILAIFIVILTVNTTCTLMMESKYKSAAFQFIFIAALGVYAIYEIQRSRDMMLATQFQNALFASALTAHCKYCLIVKRDGSVVYIDKEFQLMFPDLRKDSQLTLANMFQQGKVDNDDKEKILAAIACGERDKVIYEIRGPDNRLQKHVMSVEPITTPSGFVMLRSREYVEQRAGEGQEAIAAVAQNPLLNKTAHTLFANIMNRMHVGILITDMSGNIICANPLLEKWLTFRKGEITPPLSFTDIIYRAGEETVTKAPNDYEGEAIFQRKEGGMLTMFIKQKMIQDADDQGLGYVALINNPIDMDIDTKKKLW